LRLLARLFRLPNRQLRTAAFPRPGFVVSTVGDAIFTQALAVCTAGATAMIETDIGSTAVEFTISKAFWCDRRRIAGATVDSTGLGTGVLVTEIGRTVTVDTTGDPGPVIARAQRDSSA
jgi:hypothetical protein